MRGTIKYKGINTAQNGLRRRNTVILEVGLEMKVGAKPCQNLEAPGSWSLFQNNGKAVGLEGVQRMVV